jgi:hypothetical protein
MFWEVLIIYQNFDQFFYILMNKYFEFYKSVKEHILKQILILHWQNSVLYTLCWLCKGSFKRHLYICIIV